MSKLIILRGNSGSGKSTIAKCLQRELGGGTMLIPQDVIRREILRTEDTLDNPSIHLIECIALYGRDVGYDYVIIEGILVKERYGEMLHEISQPFDEAFTFYFDISLEETLKRHKTKPSAHEFGEKEMRKWYKERDYLGVSDEQIITDGQSESDILATILAVVRA